MDMKRLDQAENGKEIKVFKPLGWAAKVNYFVFTPLVYIRQGGEIKRKKHKTFLKKFSYATRKKVHQFCQKLIQFTPTN